jgi:hypothetical protein
MAIFNPPPPPAGYQYVVREVSGQQTYVLVKESELSSDICAATGRTWAEEARLYNIRNAPDGKEIAEPGDPFYQTAESMKNRSKDFSNISATNLKFFNDVQSATPDSQPNLAETIAKIKDGSINADITSSLSKISGMAGSLPEGVGGDLATAQAEIAAKMAQAQADLPKLMSIASANQNLTTVLSIAQTGQPPSEAALKEATGALAIFQDGPALLKSKAEAIGKSIAEAGTAFGADLTKGISEASDFVKAGLDKVTSLAQAAGAKISEFASSVPSETIPDPLNPGESIPNPDFTAFAAIPENASKLSSLSSLTSTLSSSAGDLTSSFGAIETKANTAVAGGIADLKAFAFASSLATPATGAMGAARSITLNADAFNPAMISKAFSGASKLGASIDTSLYKDTKDADLTYTGDDGLVWDRVNAERLRRNLSGLSNPRPEEPPLVPAGSTPPPAPEQSVKPQKAKEEFNEERPPSTPPKVYAFREGRKAEDKIFQSFVTQYFKVYTVFESARDFWRARQLDDAEEFYPGWKALKEQVTAIEKNKPDPATRSEEEKKLVNKRKKLLPLITENSSFWARLTYTNNRTNELATQYNILKTAWEADKTFGDLPLTVEDATKNGGPEDWKNPNSPQYSGKKYDTFAAYQKDFPNLDYSFLG